jgi:3-hydroxyacyl-[acyl-carrier-protein] dehydratase
MHTIPLQIAADHPAYAGHFPGQPVLPGVVLLDHAQLVIEQAAGVQLAGLAQAKFHRPVAPGDSLQLAWRLDTASVAFVISRGDEKVADGKFVLVTEPAA